MVLDFLIGKIIEIWPQWMFTRISWSKWQKCSGFPWQHQSRDSSSHFLNVWGNYRLQSWSLPCVLICLEYPLLLWNCWLQLWLHTSKSVECLNMQTCTFLITDVKFELFFLIYIISNCCFLLTNNYFILTIN